MNKVLYMTMIVENIKIVVNIEEIWFYDTPTSVDLDTHHPEKNISPRASPQNLKSRERICVN